MPPTLAAEGPGGAHSHNKGEQNNTAQGCTRDLTRRWAHGPANYSILLEYFLIMIYNNNNHNHNNNDNNHNSPGHGPIGVLDPSLGCVLKVPRPRKVGGPGPSAAKVGPTRSRQPRVNLRQGHGDLVFAMDSFDAFTIDPKHVGILTVDGHRT